MFRDGQWFSDFDPFSGTQSERLCLQPGVIPTEGSTQEVFNITLDTGFRWYEEHNRREGIAHFKCTLSQEEVPPVVFNGKSIKKA